MLMSHPLLYEINTRCWLAELSKKNGRPITLANVPETEFDEWRRLGFTHIWLMGVWTTGPRVRTVALKSHSRQEYSEALPDLRDEDIGASPYAISEYTVSSPLGGDPTLREFRKKLNSRGLKLLLDFVPNHLGLDHPWLKERPELFVQGPGESVEIFLEQTSVGPRWLAHGKDPYFPPWTDTVQLDYRRTDTRTAMIDVLKSVAERCDGVRCDMAMLLLNDVFTKTWEHFPVTEQHSAMAKSEFWSDAISEVRKSHPDFLFLAEAYWGLESRMQALGFDYTYDKALYDFLICRNNAEVQRHLLETPTKVIAGGAHFLENHDEKRIAALLSVEEHRAAALLILALPGLRFLHEGQLTGARLKVPVQLLRRATESANPEIQKMYELLLATLKMTAAGRGQAELLRPVEAWQGNPTAQNIILVHWHSGNAEFNLVAVNLATHPSQAYAPIVVPDSTVQDWSMKDLLGGQEFLRSTADMREKGLYLDLPAHGAQLLHFGPAEREPAACARTADTA
jgi:Alpha amylase, catalytic domain